LLADSCVAARRSKVASCRLAPVVVEEMLSDGLVAVNVDDEEVNVGEGEVTIVVVSEVGAPD